MAAETRDSPTEDKKETFQKKLKRWGKECMQVFTCYNCYKRNGDQEPEPGTSRGSVKPTTVLDSTGGDSTTEMRDMRGGPHPQKELIRPDKPAPPARSPPKPKEPYTPQLQDYAVHKMSEFPPKPFKSDTYKGVYQEILRWVKPLYYNPSLHDNFLEYSLPPKTHEKMHLLSEVLQSMANAINIKKKPPENKHTELIPVLSELSIDPGIQMDEIKSLIIISEAFKEFPRHIVENSIKTLPSEKRQRLIEFICSIPYGTHQRVFSTQPEAVQLFMDPDLQPIMTRVGFSKKQYSSDLQWDTADEDEDDKLGAGLFLLTGTDRERSLV